MIKCAGTERIRVRKFLLNTGLDGENDAISASRIRTAHVAEDRKCVQNIGDDGESFIGRRGERERVAGRDRDILQEVMALLRGQDFGIDMQFTNYRSN